MQIFYLHEHMYLQMVIYSQNWLEKQLGAARRDGATPQDGRGSEEGGATLQVTWVDHVDGLMTKKNSFCRTLGPGL